MSPVKEAALEKQSSIKKLPPQNIEAEMAVLGCMLLEKEIIPIAIEQLKSDDFYKESHREIFQAIISLYDESVAIDLVTLTEKLRATGKLELLGGATYLSTLLELVSSTAHFQHYLDIVVNKAALRHLITASTDIITRCYQPQEDIEPILDAAEKQIFEVTQKRGVGNCVPIKDLIKGTIETVEKLYQRKEYVTGLATGFVDFDVMTAGLQPSDLVIVAARPSMGKTAFALNIAEHAAIVEKQAVALFSLEMAKEQLVIRMLCSHARVDAHKVRTGFLAENDFPDLVNAAGKLAAAPIFIDDTPSISALELRSKARRLKAEHDIKLVIIDYLQLMQSSSRTPENRQQEISEISRSLKALAREIQVPVIVLSQLNRAVENRQDHRPMLSDLRESGAIEQDADLVTLLVRREYYERDNESVKGLAELIVAKQRNGPVGDITLTFNERFTRFENYTGQHENSGMAEGEEDSSTF